MTITDADSILWQSAGNEFSSSLDAYIWVSADGRAKAVDYVPGLGFISVTESGRIRSATTKATTMSASATAEIVVREVN